MTAAPCMSTQGKKKDAAHKTPTLPSWRVLRLCLEEDGRTEKRRFPGEVTRRKARMGRAFLA